MAEDEQQLKRIKSSHSCETSKDSESVTPFLSDVIVEILLRLPVKSLLRCKSVCKLWRSLISDSYFVKSHLTLSTNNNLYAHHRLIFCIVPRFVLKSCSLYDVLYHDDNPIDELELDYPLKHLRKYVRILGSCNGLLCIAIQNDDTLFIWNPSTKKSNRLPHSGRFCDVVYGFGYDESSDDYKVVGISYRAQNKAKDDTMVKIYSLKFGNWKEIGGGGFPHGVPTGDSGKFLNGSLHWASCSNDCGSWAIVSFDLAKETFGQLLLPVLDKGHEYLKLGTLGEWLCVVCTDTCLGGNHDVWVMKEYGVKYSWTKLFSIPFHVDNWIDLHFVPMFMTNDGQVLFQFGLKLLVYDTKNKSLLEIQYFDKYNESYTTFVESLVSPAGLVMMFINNNDGI